mgnify:CR=1 FL=1
MLLIGHRGFPRLFPENTVPSFIKAVELGADGVEMDVHLSRDGFPVVIHDYTVERTTDGKGYVSSLTLDELRSLEHGAKFGMKGTKIPTLEEVLKRGSSIYRGIEQKVVDCVLREKVRARIVSFDYDAIARVRKAWPEGETGIIFVGRPPYFVDIARSLGSGWLHAARDLVERGDAELAHRKGLKLDVWAPSREDEIRDAISLNPDSITTNDVELALSMLGKAHGPT